MIDMFSLELVQAVSDWQRSPGEDIKIRRGERLKQVMATLPPYFREWDQPCFRQETHKPDRTFQVLIDDKLPETIAGLGLDLNIVKTFKGGVSYDDRSIILWIVPPASGVVANLDRLFSDPDFQNALALHGPNVSYFHNGAGKYLNSQREVVLELGSLGQANILSYGGYGGTLDQLKEAFVLEHGRTPNGAELRQLEQLVG
jgi:hypothetical protein